MRLIGELEDLSRAKKFTAYLVTAEIPAKCEETEAGTYEIWVNEEDQFSAAREELAAFQADPDNPKYFSAVSQATKISREEEKKRRRIQKRIVVGTQKLKPKPRFTITLIVICVVIALWTNFGHKLDSQLLQSLQFVAVGPPESRQIIERNNENRDRLDVRLASIKRGEVWRVITQIFIHLSPIHLLFNMLWLYQLGSMIENRIGWPRMAILVLLTAAIPNFVQATMPEQFDGSVPGIFQGILLSGGGGMSGVVYGLLGFIWMKSIYDRASGFYLPQSTVMFMIGWLIFCMVPGLTEKLLGIHVANWAHAVGLIVGMAIGYAPIWRK